MPSKKENKNTEDQGFKVKISILKNKAWQGRLPSFHWI